MHIAPPYRRRSAVSSNFCVVRLSGRFLLAQLRRSALGSPNHYAEDPGRRASGASTSARRTTLTAAVGRAAGATRAARDQGEGAAQRHQPRHRAQPLPRDLGVRRPRLRPRAARVRPPGHAAPRPIRRRSATSSSAASRRPAPDVHELRPATLCTSARPTATRRCSTSTRRPPRPTRPSGCPPDAPLERWLFVSVGAVALVAAHDARIKLGDHVAVIGLGAIGLLLVQMARLAGAAPRHRSSTRWQRAASSRSRSAPTRRSTRAWRPKAPARRSSAPSGRGVDVAVETSGTTAGLHDAVAAPGLGGTVVTVGFYQGGAPELASARSGTTTGSSWSRAWARGARRTAPTRRGTARACCGRSWTCWPRARCAWTPCPSALSRSSTPSTRTAGSTRIRTRP